MPENGIVIVDERGTKLAAIETRERNGRCVFQRVRVRVKARYRPAMPAVERIVG